MSPFYSWVDAKRQVGDKGLALAMNLVANTERSGIGIRKMGVLPVITGFKLLVGEGGVLMKIIHHLS